MQVLKAQIHYCVTNVRNVIQLLQACNHNVANHAARHFRLAAHLQLRLNAIQHALDLAFGDRALGTGHPNSTQ